VKSDTAIELAQQTILQVLSVGAPMLIGALVIGVLIGIFQTVTQIQDHTLAFVPKLIGILVIIFIFLPWIVQSMSDFGKTSFKQVPELIRGE